MRRYAPLATIVLALAAACAPSEAKADDTDRARMAAMRADPIVAGAASYTERLGQTVNNGHYKQPNELNVGLAVWGTNVTGEQARSQISALLSDLRKQGWTVSGASCLGVSGGPSWTVELGGYNVRDGLPNAFHATARYNPTATSGIQVVLTTPFHSDTKTYFTEGPPGLPIGSTCVEQNTEARNGAFPAIG